MSNEIRGEFSLEDTPNLVLLWYDNGGWVLMRKSTGEVIYDFYEDCQSTEQAQQFANRYLETILVS